MPIYEYRCNSCSRRVSLFQRQMNAPLTPTCPHCQSQDLRRLVSTFSVVRSPESDLDDGALDSFEGLEENDTGAMLDHAHRLGEKMGVDLGSDFDEDVQQTLAGELGEGGDDYDI
jgi:putative FmdB family regulatory protein